MWRNGSKIICWLIGNMRQHLRMGVTVGTEGGSLGADLASLASAYDLTGMSLGVVTGPPPSFNMTLSPQPNSLQATDGSLCLANTGARARYCGGANETPW